MSKSIILCSDGTGNTNVQARGSNVFKLYESIDMQGHRDRPGVRQQLAFYDDGVGTDAAPYKRFAGNVFGWGFSENIRDLYIELVHAYEPGDELYLFGFSRGAYTVRALAGMIQYCGIIDVSKNLNLRSKSGLEKHVKRCWGEFHRAAFTGEWDVGRKARMPSDPVATADPKTVHPRTAARRARMLSHEPASPIRIRLLGVWDTVGAVAMPVDELKWVTDLFWKSRFNDLVPGKEVERACQALSIDDERRTFKPELWNESGARAGQVEQVWFAGVHSNVGGGYPRHGMSLVALDWMMAEAEACGLRFNHADREYVRTHQDVHDKLYDSRSGLGVYYRWEPRNVARIAAEHGVDAPKVHVSVFDRIAVATEGYCPGNLPLTLQVVGTRGRTVPTQDAMGAVGVLVSTAIVGGGGPTLLDRAPMRSMVALGRFSYYAFLALTFAAVGYVLYGRVPEGLGAWGSLTAMGGVLCDAAVLLVESPFMALDSFLPVLGELLLAPWFLPVAVVCFFAAAIVDEAMERYMSDFWHLCRASLRSLLGISPAK